MIEPTLKDATIWRWWFFLNWHAHESVEAQSKHWGEFSDALESVVQWGGGWTVSIMTRPNYLQADRQASIRYASLPWSKTDGGKRCVEARRMLDASYIQTGYSEEGAAPIETAVRLVKEGWKWEGRGHSYLGDAGCLSTELEEDAKEEDVRSLIHATLKSWLQSDVTQFAIVKLYCGFLAIPSGLNADRWILPVWNTSEARKQAAHFIHRLMPPLLLARLKGFAIMQEVEKNLLPQAQQIETQLAAELKNLPSQPQRLSLLEHSSDVIAKHQVSLAEKLNNFEELLETLNVNTANIERLLSDPLLLQHHAELDELLAAPLKLGAKQVGVDLRYLTLSQIQADKVLQGISTMAQLRSAHWERTLAILFGVFTVFEVLTIFHAFPNLHEQHWLVQTAAIFSSVAGALAIAIIIRWILSRW